MVPLLAIHNEQEHLSFKTEQQERENNDDPKGLFTLTGLQHKRSENILIYTAS